MEINVMFVVDPLDPLDLTPCDVAHCRHAAVWRFTITINGGATYVVKYCDEVVEDDAMIGGAIVKHYQKQFGGV